ncbi:hypothetical protein ACP6PL_25365 [Dapis sp. BLCC M126]|uniref:hypothetical protein n=1 Tax=Dapis sp. BLCC M126 TaxID=3400189 RepID=UPI003CF78D97
MNNFSLGKEGQEFESRERAYYQNLADEEKQRQEEKKRLEREREERRSLYQQQQKEIQQKLESEKQERRSLVHIGQLESLRFKYLYNALETKERKVKIENELTQLKAEYPEFLRFGIRKALGYFFMLSFFFAVLVINFVLIKQPVEYLASQAFPPGSFAVTLATILLPVVIILFELGICSQLFSAKMSPFSQNEIQLWQRLANTIVWVTPTMLVGTSVALYSGEDWPPELYDIILLVAMAILAYVTDAGIVYGYDRYQNGFAFFWFRINHLLREQKLRDCKRMFYHEKSQFIPACQDYEEAINQHNQKFKSQVKFVPINVYFDDVYPQQFSLSGKASNLD